MLYKEWSLVGFTLAIQAVVGLLAAVCIFEIWADIATHHGQQWAIIISVMKVAFVLMIIGNVTASFHLATPKNALRSLRNLKSSWLSREVLLTILLTGFVILLTPMAIYQAVRMPVFLAAIAVSAILGFILLVVMSKVYMLRTVTTWNSLTTPIDFMVASALLGILAYLSIKVSILPSLVGGINPDVLIVALVSVFAAGVRLITLLFMSLQKALTTTGKQNKWIIMQTIQLVGGIFVLIAAMVFRLPVVVYPAVSLIVISEIMGRIQFYNSYRTIGI